MEAARADIAYVSWLYAFIVTEWGGLPNYGVLSGGIHKGVPSDKPQCVSVIKLGHFPKTGQPPCLNRNANGLTCCIFPSMIVGEA